MYSCGVRGAHGGLRRRESGTPAGTSRGPVYGVQCVQCTVLYMRGSSYTAAGAQLRANSGHNQSIRGNTHYSPHKHKHKQVYTCNQELSCGWRSKDDITSGEP